CGRYRSAMTDALAIARGLLGAASVGDGPTPEQHGLIQNLLHGYFGVDADVATLGPLDAAGLAGAVDEQDRRRVVDLLVVVEFCRHPATAAQADRAEEYAQALTVDAPLLVVARDALMDKRAELMKDWSRFRETSAVEPGVRADDPALGARLRSLGDCPTGSLGRAYFEFHERWQLSFPGEAGGGAVSLVSHDFSHVLAGYEPDAPGELALQAMLTSATGFEHHFSGLVASLSLYEVGMFDYPGITPRVGGVDRPGAAAELAEGFARGARCTTDFQAIDHLARAGDPLEAVRADCGIPPRSG
ncbi:MAG TPA: hypothetical protein VF152_10110, partial [Acidimicrobiia bacterium]